MDESEKKLANLKNITDIDDILFDLLSEDAVSLTISKFWGEICKTGLRKSDPRLEECRKEFKRAVAEADCIKSDVKLDRETFKRCIHHNIVLAGRAFKNQFIIPEFDLFIDQINEMYECCKKNCSGKVADYIPQLSRFDPSYWGVSICTIDGQRHAIGDVNVPFCIQSCSKPLNYALALSDRGADYVHNYVGQEPSGRSFNEMALDTTNKPHNPMINSGAIITTGLLKPDLSCADRFDYVHNQYKSLAGGEFVGFSNATYLSERETADRNFALGYYMRENKCFPPNAELVQTLEFYFQLCSIEVTAESGSVIAATLANGGICPLTGEKILSGDAVRNTLSLMYSCGMYDYSGQFAFQVGLPGKSGVAGMILLVIPNVMGICTWSPPLDEMGNSVRGIQFCQALVNKFSFHNYDNLKHTTQKSDPRKRQLDTQANSIVNILFAAANGDITAMRRFALSGMDLANADYDGRTAMHLAAAEGHLSIIKFLMDKSIVQPDPKDRWGFTPLDDAKKFGHSDIVEYLDTKMKKIANGEKRLSND